MLRIFINLYLKGKHLSSFLETWQAVLYCYPYLIDLRKVIHYKLYSRDLKTIYNGFNLQSEMRNGKLHYINLGFFRVQ